MPLMVIFTSMCPRISALQRKMPPHTTVCVVVTSSLLAFTIVILYTLVPLAGFVNRVATPYQGLFHELITSSRPANFSEHDDYRNMSHQFDSLWTDLLTSNGGFIYKTEKDNRKHKYGISMFHQLHCLAILRGAFQMFHETMDPHQVDLRETPAHRRGEEMQRNPNPHESHYDQDHWTHCFDYLRQVSDVYSFRGN